MGERIQKQTTKSKVKTDSNSNLLSNCCGLIGQQYHKKNFQAANKNLVITIHMKKMESPSKSTTASTSHQISNKENNVVGDAKSNSSSSSCSSDWEQNLSNKLNNNNNLSNNQNQNVNELQQKSILANKNIDSISGYKLINNKSNVNVFEKSDSTNNSNSCNVNCNNDTNNNSNDNNNGMATQVAFTTGNSVTSYPVVTPIKKPTAPTTPSSPSTKSSSDSNGNRNTVDDLLSSSSSLSPFDFRFNPEDLTTIDCDERARLQRAIEIEEGIEIDQPTSTQMLRSPSTSLFPLSPSPHHAVNNVAQVITLNPANGLAAHLPNPQMANLRPIMTSSTHSPATPDVFQIKSFNINGQTIDGEITRIHSQDFYMHCLVPDLQKITACCFYWGKMDRYEAEKLLDGKPEGTFLLRDSAQEEFLFSVSFRKYGRSLHARIEQFNHKFSFDSHDPSVFTATTVTGLLEHYKDPTCVMFFEPMLTSPLNRNFCFSLQQLCRAVIVSSTTYDGINDLCLPNSLKSYLKEYHYKQRVRVKRFDNDSIFTTASS